MEFTSENEIKWAVNHIDRLERLIESREESIKQAKKEILDLLKAIPEVDWPPGYLLYDCDKKTKQDMGKSICKLHDVD